LPAASTTVDGATISLPGGRRGVTTEKFKAKNGNRERIMKKFEDDGVLPVEIPLPADKGG
jgi:hypothetical protein